jgi:hypothetical protein
MDKDTFDKLLSSLQERKYTYNFDYYLDRGRSIIRGIFLYGKGEDHLKGINRTLLKNIKPQKTYSWYLGEKKKAVYLKFKDELEMEIPELEAYPVNNYA